MTSIAIVLLTILAATGALVVSPFVASFLVLRFEANPESWAVVIAVGLGIVIAKQISKNTRNSRHN